MTFETLTAGIKELFESTKFLGDYLDVEYIINFKVFQDKDESFTGFCDTVNVQIDESEVIYYSRAINFLMENDISLTESMQLASDFGYSPENINSELLATLLLQSELRSNFNEIEDLVMDLFDQYEDSNEEE